MTVQHELIRIQLFQGKPFSLLENTRKINRLHKTCSLGVGWGWGVRITKVGGEEYAIREPSHIRNNCTVHTSQFAQVYGCFYLLPLALGVPTSPPVLFPSSLRTFYLWHWGCPPRHLYSSRPPSVPSTSGIGGAHPATCTLPFLPPYLLPLALGVPTPPPVLFPSSLRTFYLWHWGCPPRHLYSSLPPSVPSTSGIGGAHPATCTLPFLPPYLLPLALGVPTPPPVLFPSSLRTFYLWHWGCPPRHLYSSLPPSVPSTSGIGGAHPATCTLPFLPPYLLPLALGVPTPPPVLFPSSLRTFYLWHWGCPPRHLYSSLPPSVPSTSGIGGAHPATCTLPVLPPYLLPLALGVPTPPPVLFPSSLRTFYLWHWGCPPRHLYSSLPPSVPSTSGIGGAHLATCTLPFLPPYLLPLALGVPTPPPVLFPSSLRTFYLWHWGCPPRHLYSSRPPSVPSTSGIGGAHPATCTLPFLPPYLLPLALGVPTPPPVLFPSSLRTFYLWHWGCPPRHLYSSLPPSVPSTSGIGGAHPATCTLPVLPPYLLPLALGVPTSPPVLFPSSLRTFYLWHWGCPPRHLYSSLPPSVPSTSGIGGAHLATCTLPFLPPYLLPLALGVPTSPPVLFPSSLRTFYLWHWGCPPRHLYSSLPPSVPSTSGIGGAHPATCTLPVLPPYLLPLANLVMRLLVFHADQRGPTETFMRYSML